MTSFVPKKVVRKFMHVSDQPVKRSDGESLVFFMGAGYCPYCAAERWAIIEALGRFGNLKGMVEDWSADHDEKYLNVPTFSFSRAKYDSNFVTFVGRETADRNFEPLNEIGEQDYGILDAFNPDQIIPFLLIDGQFIQVGSGFSPKLLEGLDHQKVKVALGNLNSQVGRAIHEEIDNIAALICKSIGGKAEICDFPDVKNLMAKF